MMERVKTFFGNIEYWMLERDLHIWYTVVSLIALGVLLFIVDKEINKTVNLSSQLIIVQEDMRVLRLRNIDLLTELDKQRVIPAPITKPEPQAVDRAVNKVNDKINKVQDVLIDKASSQTKIIKTTQTTLVPTPTVVNKELNSMMFESYCSTVPDSPKCKMEKKK